MKKLSALRFYARLEFFWCYNSTMKKVVKTTKKKSMTIEDLAAMTQRGFDGVQKENGGVKQEIGGVKQELGEVKKELGKVVVRLDRIETRVNQLHDARLDKLDDQMRRVITIFEKKLEIPFPR